MSVVGFTPLNANGCGMKRWGLRSDSLSRYTTLDASHNPLITDETPILYIACYRQFIFVNIHNGHPSNHPFQIQLSTHLLIQH